jgi:hypothetical protein
MRLETESSTNWRTTAWLSSFYRISDDTSTMLLWCTWVGSQMCTCIQGLNTPISNGLVLVDWAFKVYTFYVLMHFLFSYDVFVSSSSLYFWLHVIEEATRRRDSAGVALSKRLLGPQLYEPWTHCAFLLYIYLGYTMSSIIFAVLHCATLPYAELLFGCPADVDYLCALLAGRHTAWLSIWELEQVFFSG